MTPPIVMHQNYCEQGQGLEETCRKAVDWGYDGIEFRRGRPNSDQGPEAYLDEVYAAAHRAGLRRVVFGGPGPNLSAPEAERRAAEVDEAIRFYRLAAERFDLPVCNAIGGPIRCADPAVPWWECEQHGSGAATEEQWGWAADGLRRLAEAAGEIGLRLALETHMSYIHDLPETSMRLAERVGHPAVGVNLDYGNIVYFQKPPSLAEAIRRCGDRLYYVHVKNSYAPRTGGRFPTSLQDGEINHREFLRLLRDAAYAGPICTEAPRPGDREWFAREDVGYLRSVLKDLGW